MSPKRPGIKQDNVTNILRKAPLTQPEPTSPENDDQEGSQSCRASNTNSSLGTKQSLQYELSTSSLSSYFHKQPGSYLSAATAMLSWSGQFQGNVAFCSGTKLSRYLDDIFGAGPHFCLQGSMHFRIRDVVVPQQNAAAYLKALAARAGKPDHSGSDTSNLSQSARIEAVGGKDRSRGLFKSLQRGMSRPDLPHSVSTADSSCILVPDRDLSASLPMHGSPAYAAITGEGDREQAALWACDTCSTDSLMAQSMNVASSSTWASGTIPQGSRQGSLASKDAAPLTLGDFMQQATCEFWISEKHLTQQREWVGGQYRHMRWTNILPPQLFVEMSVQEAVQALSAHPLAPEVCLNKA